jgi:hypothetical protein
LNLLAVPSRSWAHLSRGNFTFDGVRNRNHHCLCFKAKILSAAQL